MTAPADPNVAIDGRTHRAPLERDTGKRKLRSALVSSGLITCFIAQRYLYQTIHVERVSRHCVMKPQAL
jgi:hypothetical protein